jgi:ribosome-associated heat shock protein Hsp15
MRLDRLLYQLRFARSRAAAQRWIQEGRIRRNSARVLRQDQPVEVGDVLTLPLAREVIVIELLAQPSRRGPPAEARACYRQLDAGGTNRLAGGETQRAEGKALP